MPKIETVRFDGRTISEVRKKFRQWYEDNRAKIGIVNNTISLVDAFTHAIRSVIGAPSLSRTSVPDHLRNRQGSRS